MNEKAIYKAVYEVKLNVGESCSVLIELGRVKGVSFTFLSIFTPWPFSYSVMLFRLSEKFDRPGDIVLV